MAMHMTEKQKLILAIASESFMRHGVRRTTMSDIAQQASVSRPTLYGHYAGKDELLAGVIGYWFDTMIGGISAELNGGLSLPDALDILFERSVLHVYDLMQSLPDASDVVSGDSKAARDAYEAGLRRLEHLVEDLLAEYHDAIERHGQSLSEYARFIVSAAMMLKQSKQSREDLVALLLSLKTSILCVAEAN